VQNHRKIIGLFIFFFYLHQYRQFEIDTGCNFNDSKQRRIRRSLEIKNDHEGIAALFDSQAKMPNFSLHKYLIGFIAPSKQTATVFLDYTDSFTLFDDVQKLECHAGVFNG